MNTYSDVQKMLTRSADKKKAAFFPSFFKTGKGQYGEGDVFIGVTVPKQRLVAKQFADLPLTEIKKLLYSKIHEERLTALLILVGQFQKGDIKKRTEIFNFYLVHKARVNNWDLVDTSAHLIVGAHLDKKPLSLLDTLAKSNSLWDRRIAMIATYHFIKTGRFEPTLKLAKLLLNDTEDLMHKAVGWMLREMGKKSLPHLKMFLAQHVTLMPRTMLRYAIEKFPEPERKKYLSRK